VSIIRGIGDTIELIMSQGELPNWNQSLNIKKKDKIKLVNIINRADSTVDMGKKVLFRRKKLPRMCAVYTFQFSV
jgi:hypothetical protein